MEALRIFWIKLATKDCPKKKKKKA
jgi:hypothetical protein